MIIVNGNIELITRSAPVRDTSTGYFTAAEEIYGDAIPCQYVIEKSNNVGRKDGEAFTLCSYKIFIRKQEVEASRLRLSDVDGTEKGIFSILSVEELKAVEETLILV